MNGNQQLDDDAPVRRFEYDDGTRVLAADLGVAGDASVDVVDDDSDRRLRIRAVTTWRSLQATRKRLSKRGPYCRSDERLRRPTMKLTVKPLKQKDAGRGLAAIDRSAMTEMDPRTVTTSSSRGGENRVVARVWPGYPEDEGRGIVRIDGQLRQEANVGIDDRVNVEKADVQVAKAVTVALPQNLRVRGNVGPMIRNNLSGQAVTQGQTVPVSFGLGPLSSMSGQKIPLKIAETEPEGTVIVTDQTDIEVSEQPAEQVSGGHGRSGEGERETPDVAYEDIGGLDDGFRTGPRDDRVADAPP